ncbi:MAG: hypothetical protein AAGE52_18230 [Myxococcota bacterium]
MKKTSDKPTPQDNDRKSPPLPDSKEVLRRCAQERLGHRFGENTF